LRNQVVVDCNAIHGLNDIPLVNNTTIRSRNNTTITCYQNGDETNSFTVNLRDTSPPYIQQHPAMSIDAPILPGAFLNYHVFAADPDNSRSKIAQTLHL
jgi:hypothetical protein